MQRGIRGIGHIGLGAILDKSELLDVHDGQLHMSNEDGCILSELGYEVAAVVSV